MSLVNHVLNYCKIQNGTIYLPGDKSQNITKICVQYTALRIQQMQITKNYNYISTEASISTIHIKKDEDHNNPPKEPRVDYVYLFLPNVCLLTLLSKPVVAKKIPGSPIYSN